MRISADDDAVPSRVMAATVGSVRKAVMSVPASARGVGRPRRHDVDEVSEAQLHYDRAVYHATCADRERMLGALDAAAAYGWSEPALLTHEPAFEFCRDDSALLDILDCIAARGRLPEDAPTRAPSGGSVRMTFGDARSRVEAAGSG